MKVFIVSIGIILLQLTALVFHSDLGAYNNSKYMLKMLAEECAAGSALRLNEDELGSGNIVFSASARAYTDNLVAYANANYPVFRGGTVSVGSFETDSEGGRPYVTVELIYTSTTDFFRLPVINVTQITHETKYEYLQLERLNNEC